MQGVLKFNLVFSLTVITSATLVLWTAVRAYGFYKYSFKGYINVIYKSFTITVEVRYFKILFRKSNVTELVFKDFSDLELLGLNFIRGNRPRRGFCGFSRFRQSSVGIVVDRLWRLPFKPLPVCHSSINLSFDTMYFPLLTALLYNSSTDATTATTTTTTTATTTITTTTTNNNNNNSNGRDSVVGIVATGYTVRGTNPSRDEFSAPFHTCPGAHSAYYTVGPGSFPGVKWSGRGFNHPHPSSTEVKEDVDLYFYSPLWQVIGWTFMSGIVVVVVKDTYYISLFTITNNKCFWFS